MARQNWAESMEGALLAAAHSRMGRVGPQSQAIFDRPHPRATRTSTGAQDMGLSSPPAAGWSIHKPRRSMRLAAKGDWDGMVGQALSGGIPLGQGDTNSLEGTGGLRDQRGEGALGGAVASRERERFSATRKVSGSLIYRLHGKAQQRRLLQPGQVRPVASSQELKHASGMTAPFAVAVLRGDPPWEAKERQKLCRHPNGKNRK